MLEYLKANGMQATERHFKIYGSMIRKWQRANGNAEADDESRARARPWSKVKARGGRKPFTKYTEAVIHLERWAARKTGAPTDDDLDVWLALRALRGRG